MVVEVAGADAEARVVRSDVGDVAADEGLSMGGGFQEGESEAFGDGGGDDVGGVGEPGLEGGRGGAGGGEAVDDIEGDGEVLAGDELLPGVVDVEGVRVERSAADGDAGAGGGEG